MAQELSRLRKDDRSIGELFSELAGETGTLVRQEIALAQVEITKKATDAGKQVGMIAAGGAVGYTALLAGVAGFILVLDRFMPAWLAAFIAAALIGIAAYVMITSGLERLKKTKLAPNETVESIKEDAQWLKNQVTQ